MLHLDTTNEARALAYVAEVEGTDPEAAAIQWQEATIREARAVVALAQARFGLSTESEWAADFLSAHRWIRTNPHVWTAPARGDVLAGADPLACGHCGVSRREHAG